MTSENKGGVPLESSPERGFYVVEAPSREAVVKELGGNPQQEFVYYDTFQQQRQKVSGYVASKQQVDFKAGQTVSGEFSSSYLKPEDDKEALQREAESRMVTRRENIQKYSSTRDAVPSSPSPSAIGERLRSKGITTFQGQPLNSASDVTLSQGGFSSVLGGSGVSERSTSTGMFSDVGGGVGVSTLLLSRENVDVPTTYKVTQEGISQKSVSTAGFSAVGGGVGVSTYESVKVDTKMQEQLQESLTPNTFFEKPFVFIKEFGIEKARGGLENIKTGNVFQKITGVDDLITGVGTAFVGEVGRFAASAGDLFVTTLKPETTKFGFLEFQGGTIKEDDIPMLQERQKYVEKYGEPIQAKTAERVLALGLVGQPIMRTAGVSTASLNAQYTLRVGDGVVRTSAPLDKSVSRTGGKGKFVFDVLEAGGEPYVRTGTTVVKGTPFEVTVSTKLMEGEKVVSVGEGRTIRLYEKPASADSLGRVIDVQDVTVQSGNKVVRVGRTYLSERGELGELASVDTGVVLKSRRGQSVETILTKKQPSAEFINFNAVVEQGRTKFAINKNTGATYSPKVKADIGVELKSADKPLQRDTFEVIGMRSTSKLSPEGTQLVESFTQDFGLKTKSVSTKLLSSKSGHAQFSQPKQVVEKYPINTAFSNKFAVEVLGTSMRISRTSVFETGVSTRPFPLISSSFSDLKETSSLRNSTFSGVGMRQETSLLSVQESSLRVNYAWDTLPVYSPMTVVRQDAGLKILVQPTQDISLRPDQSTMTATDVDELTPPSSINTFVDTPQPPPPPPPTGGFPFLLPPMFFPSGRGSGRKGRGTTFKTKYTPSLGASYFSIEPSRAQNVRASTTGIGVRGLSNVPKKKKKRRKSQDLRFNKPL